MDDRLQLDCVGTGYKSKGTRCAQPVSEKKDKPSYQRRKGWPSCFAEYSATDTWPIS